MADLAVEVVDQKLLTGQNRTGQRDGSEMQQDVHQSPTRGIFTLLSAYVHPFLHNGETTYTRCLSSTQTTISFLRTAWFSRRRGTGPPWTTRTIAIATLWTITSIPSQWYKLQCKNPSKTKTSSQLSARRTLNIHHNPISTPSEQTPTSNPPNRSFQTPPCRICACTATAMSRQTLRIRESNPPLLAN